MTDAAASTDDSEQLLDDLEVYARLDPDGMGSTIAGLGSQVRDAWATGSAWDPPADFTTPERVVVVGMGGSAIGADIIATVARIESPIAVEVVRDYNPPPPAAGTLTIASSVSGNTEETLAAFEAARRGPGMHLAITGGGALAALGGPSLQYEWDFHPRAALGWGMMPLAAVLTRLGVLSIDNDEVQSIASTLDVCAGAWGPTNPTASNRAKQIAERVRGRLPVIVGTEFLDVAARRWAGQVQENAKQWAFATALPEMNHNFINGFGLPSPAVDHLELIFLDATDVHPRNRRRIELTGQSLDEAGVAHTTQVIGGRSPLEIIVHACSLADWVSYYLAMLNGVDPSDTSPIEIFKNRMG